MSTMGKRNSCLSWASLQLYIGMSQARHLLTFMKFYANLSGWDGLFFFLITLWKSYNLFVQLHSKLHCISQTSSFFLVYVWICQIAVWQTTFGWVFVLNLHLISCVEEWWGEVTVPGERGGVFVLGKQEIVWGVVPGRRERQGRNRLDTYRGSKLCREQISSLEDLLNNLPWSAGIIKILPPFRKVHSRLELTWRQGFVLALVFM